MTVFSGKRVFAVDYEAEVSQRLLEASHSGDLKLAMECISDPFVDVNFVGAVCLKTRKTDVVLRDESPTEVRVEHEEFKTDVTALFLAVHSGNVRLVKKLLNTGADVNQKLFKGFATTAAVREGHLDILEVLLKAGASQPACEEALFEASCHGLARLTELLMGSDLIRPQFAVHALVTACCRGFADVVETLIKCGVDVSAADRVLLQSLKPSLHTNVDCTALVAAVVNRQVPVVRLLLQTGAKVDISVRLGAWSWDTCTGEECRVGAGLGEPYTITWCAVEYFEMSGAILRMLLQHLSPNTPLYGRTLLHHAILCDAGETALMISAKYKHKKCLKVLMMAGADFGLVNVAGESVGSIAGSNRWSLGFQQSVLDVLKGGRIPRSSNISVFSPLVFAAHAGDAEALKAVIGSGEFNLDQQDGNGFSVVMVTAMKGHVEAFRLLVYAGADVKLCNKSGQNAITLSESNQNHELFEKAREGHESTCQLLISHGAHCNVKNARGETALQLARKSKNGAESVILDELARKLVLGGAYVQKHTKGGRGSPHRKEIRMVGSAGVLRWGKSSRRNVMCREAELGPSLAFRKYRRNKGDADEPGVFRVVTTKNKEMHFVCNGGGFEAAELWVRGIKLVTKEAKFVK
ncbi:Ankyrin [Quillaja saponaria]|uniref:Ankyrin n=1 Tax=Quillaja saponaria TaxID=32244 RepID=A0AAD7Q4M8_QUISA|nr:Ankyrin [Quillaja saponaria]